MAKVRSRGVDLFDDPPWTASRPSDGIFRNDWESRRAWEITAAALVIAFVGVGVALLAAFGAIFGGIFPFG